MSLVTFWNDLDSSNKLMTPKPNDVEFKSVIR